MRGELCFTFDWCCLSPVLSIFFQLLSVFPDEKARHATNYKLTELIIVLPHYFKVVVNCVVLFFFDLLQYGLCFRLRLENLLSVSFFKNP